MDFFKQWQQYHYQTRYDESTNIKERMFLKTTLDQLKSDINDKPNSIPYRSVPTNNIHIKHDPFRIHST